MIEYIRYKIGGENMKQIETERKYIIEKPDIKDLEAQDGFSASYITQIYIADPKRTHRIRKREYLSGEIEYTENTKERISKMSSVEREIEITESEFNALSLNIEEGSRILKKKRITFDFSGKTFEIDIYPEWERCSILEVELDREDEKIEIPDFIKIVKEVTGIREYSNHRMAHSFPREA